MYTSFRCLHIGLLLLIGLAWITSAAQAQRVASTKTAQKSAAINAQPPVLMAQRGHVGLVFPLAFSPDGRYILTGSDDDTARLWEATTGKEVRCFEGYAHEVNAVAFSPDGRYVLTGSDVMAWLWDKSTGKEVRRFKGHTKQICAVAFSPDGKYVLTGSVDTTARLWETSTGKQVRYFIGHTKEILSVAFSPNGRYVLTAGARDKTARLWETGTGKEIRRFEGHRDQRDSNDIMDVVAFSPNGRYVLTGGAETARMWDKNTGKEVRRFVVHDGMVGAVAFSPTGQYVLTVSDGTSQLWDAHTGKEVLRFAGKSHRATTVAFSPNGKYIVTGNNRQAAILWNAHTGKEVLRFSGNFHEVNAVAFSPDGRYLLTGSGFHSSSGTAQWWETTTGKEVRRFEGNMLGVTVAACSSDSRYVLTGSEDAVRLWETASGKEVRRFEETIFDMTAVAFSPDGRYVLASKKDYTFLWDKNTGKEVRRFAGHSASFSSNGRYLLTLDWSTAHLWETDTGMEKRRFEGDKSSVRHAAFSPDGRYVLTISDDCTAKLWDAATGNEVRHFAGRFKGVDVVAFSPDSKYVLIDSKDITVASWDARVALWETATGKEVRRFNLLKGLLRAVAFSPDGRYMLMSGRNGSVTLLSVETGEDLCHLIAFKDGTWAVTDRIGRYDASNGGEVQGLHWVVKTPRGPEAMALSQLKARYYDPGLLSKYLGHNPVPLRPVNQFTGVERPPAITAQPPTGSRTILTLTLWNQGGGIGPVWIKVNGKLVSADVRGPQADVNAAQSTLTVELAGAPVLLGQDNEIEIVSHNGAGWLASAPMHLAWRVPGKATTQPHLYALVAGINTYSGGEIHPLHYPAHDAAQIAQALQLGAEKLLGPGKFHLFLLSDDSKDARALPPSKENFNKAFAEIARQATSEDIVVVYLAGHGTAFVDPKSRDVSKDTYCYLTQEATGFDLRDPQVRARCSLTSKELAVWTDGHHIKALKQALILDTCYAGTATNDLFVRRADAAEQENGTRALAELKDRTSFFVLMGCARDASSYESSQFGQGLLTYALLLGLKGESLRDGEYVDASAWLQYAAHRVVDLAQQTNNMQQPQVMQRADYGESETVRDKQTASFLLGRLTEAEKRQIVLSEPHPLILRPTFLSNKGRDDLQLSASVRKQLRAASYVAGRGEAGSAVYLDVPAEDRPGAIAVSGIYTVSGQIIHLNLVLSKDGKEVEQDVESDKDNLSAKTLQVIQTGARKFFHL